MKKTVLWKSLVIFTLFLVYSQANAQLIEHLYDFNDLELGDLNGQDDWTTVVNAGGSPNEMDVAFTYQGVVSHDGTKAAFYGQSGGNYGRTGSRPSTDNLPFSFTNGGIMEIEIDIHTGWWGTYYCLGYDANNNGYIIPAIETVVNCEPDEGGVGFHIANQSPSLLLFIMPDGSTVPFTYDSISGWNSFKMFIDLEANDGSGSVTLFIKEIGGGWNSISEIQDLDLGLTSGTGTSTDPATWTKMFIHATGGTSGFDNIIIRQPDPNAGLYQYITFDPIPDHLTTDDPFSVEAASSLGLPVQLTLEDGPATLSGNVVTLTGEPGFVTIVASQPGNDTVAPAENITRTFEVVDGSTVIPEINIKNATDGSVVRSPGLTAVPFSVSTSIDYPHVLSVEEVKFEVDGEVIIGFPTNNGYFMGQWIPPAHGSYALTATATSSAGVSESVNITFEVVAEAPTLDVTVLDHYDFNEKGSLNTTIILPSFSGTYSHVIAYLTYDCPCDPWDRIANVKIRGANGEFVELFRYITPYGVACEDQIDITDYVSQLQGEVDFVFNFTESIVTVEFEYQSGTPEYTYSWMDNLWFSSYPFGDPSNLQPLEIQTLSFAPDIQAAYLRLMSSGHGWGSLNTGNAAEFYETTHNIKINDEVAFVQEIWQECNPNPVSCQPQNGTWYYDRHGWCPGSIPKLFRFDLTPYLSVSQFELMYEFAPEYMDECHPQNPDCITGVTCADCNNTGNPSILVAGELIKYSNSIITNTKNPASNTMGLKISPNPAMGWFELSLREQTQTNMAKVEILSLSGHVISRFTWDGENKIIDLSSLSEGLYLVKVYNDDFVHLEKLIVQ